MKKILMTLVAAVIAVSASAQVYVGGSLGIGEARQKAVVVEAAYCTALAPAPSAGRSLPA